MGTTKFIAHVKIVLPVGLVTLIYCLFKRLIAL